jgi:hypothetical protein
LVDYLKIWIQTWTQQNFNLFCHIGDMEIKSVPYNPLGDHTQMQTIMETNTIYFQKDQWLWYLCTHMPKILISHISLEKKAMNTLKLLLVIRSNLFEIQSFQGSSILLIHSWKICNLRWWEEMFNVDITRNIVSNMCPFSWDHNSQAMFPKDNTRG